MIFLRFATVRRLQTCGSFLNSFVNQFFLFDFFSDIASRYLYRRYEYRYRYRYNTSSKYRVSVSINSIFKYRVSISINLKLEYRAHLCLRVPNEDELLSVDGHSTCSEEVELQYYKKILEEEIFQLCCGNPPSLVPVND